MRLNLLSPAKSLFPAFRAQHVGRACFEQFRAELLRLFERLDHAAGESEEHLKNNVADFLKGAWYGNAFYLNTRDRQDLVVHNGPTAKDPAGVIIETKKPGNKAEMISAAKPNAKALHELLRYYLNERQLGANRDIKRLVVTNIEEWFVFDAADFERQIYANAKLIKNFTDWHEKRLGAGNTDWFYKEIAAPFFDNDIGDIACTHFRLSDYRAAAANTDPADDEALLDLYKILSPEHLLKKPFSNDSNALNKPFYDELLYLLGLEEVKEGGKKLIQRAEKRRQEGSLLENTLNKLDVTGKWRKAPELAGYGDSDDAIRFSIALELCITWLNRILFLKLLEGQLKRWRPDEALSRFLRPDFIRDFDDLHELFFEVLNRPYEQRIPTVQARYGRLPYLNSSLFEITPLEDAVFSVNELKDRLELPLAPQTALRDATGQRRGGRQNTLHYLLEFLDAYDFSAEGKARIQAEQRDVINASVLGLIFEKINGYRDGSFFTPGFITMYMCRETLRRAVLHKFNQAYGWSCPDFDSLYNHLDPGKIAEYNALLNSLRCCDPAVGSGHFLVSALNELIAIKSELGLLADRQGRRLRELRAVVGNDELLLTDAETDQPFESRPGLSASQRVQEALFHEKQTLIENCLFGVDINPKSVMICQLRLWIELLKNAYFSSPSSGGGRGEALETLPNIDINIKCGNSLISRFALDEDLSDVFRRQKFSRADYLDAVQ
ncbi:MAG: restriction endonuclease, partial [Saprospiraceae bacterium]|nr:restriction endonuclease [Saprospiraceae bacterium]